jgi:hypothetical protein
VALVVLVPRTDEHCNTAYHVQLVRPIVIARTPIAIAQYARTQMLRAWQSRCGMGLPSSSDDNHVCHGSCVWSVCCSAG